MFRWFWKKNYKFEEVIWDDINYLETIKFSKNELYEKIISKLINKFTKINNLFIKKDNINTSAMYDNTRETDWT